MSTIPSYAISFRGYWACPCLAEWLPVFEAELQRRDLLTGPLRIYQLIGFFSGSSSTHSKGGAFDILDLPGAEDQWVARQMGADATWARPFNWDGKGGIAHTHGVLRGCPHNGPARYQYDSLSQGVDHGRDGLSHGGVGGPDTGPRPLSGRTWREGIAWAREQGDDMFEEADSNRLKDVQKTLNELAKDARRRNVADIERTRRIIKKVTGVDADLARVEKALAEDDE